MPVILWRAPMSSSAAKSVMSARSATTRPPARSSGSTGARRLGIATPTIVNTATRMEEAGLVTRKPDPADARLVRLYLTPSGLSAREPVREARAALERRATATLTAAELGNLRSALTKITAQLQDKQA